MSKSERAAEHDGRLSSSKSREAQKILRKLFPKCFHHSDKNHFPLKTGIHKDLKVELKAKGIEMSVRAQKAALRSYTRHRNYTFALFCCSHRIDLYGNKCEVVTEQEKVAAREQQKLDSERDEKELRLRSHNKLKRLQRFEMKYK